jgi:hypothetical protein
VGIVRLVVLELLLAPHANLGRAFHRTSARVSSREVRPRTGCCLVTNRVRIFRAEDSLWTPTSRENIGAS